MTDDEVSNPCYDCGHSVHECMKSKPQCKKDIEWCDHCGCGVDWDRLPDSYKLTTQQSHPWGSTIAVETIVVGFKCPDCGKENIF